jgi:hypothetical protein
VTELLNQIEIGLPQHLLEIYSKYFESQGSNFFTKFLNLYIDASYRKMGIEAEYNQQKAAFFQAHPGIDGFELEEVKLPPKLTYGLNQGVYTKIVQEIKDKRAEEKQKLVELRKDIKKIKEEKLKPLKNEKKEARKKQLQEPKNSMIWNKIEKQIQSINQDIEDQNNRIAFLEVQISEAESLRYTFQQQLQNTLIVETEKRGIEAPVITKGELVNLYMNIKREQAMHDRMPTNDPTEPVIKATQHFEVGGAFQIFDSEHKNKGKKYSKAKQDADKKFYIIVQTRQDMLTALEEVLNTDPQYQILVDEAKRVYKQNYKYINEIYDKKFRVSLPKEEEYSPFRTNNSDWVRNFDLKSKNKINLGASDGFTLETTFGARTPLVIQNVTSVMDGVTQATATYSYERIITDFQSLAVSKVKNTGLTYAQVLAQVDGGNFLKIFENIFRNILGYSNRDSKPGEELLTKFQNMNIRVTMAFGFPTLIKQGISTIPISFISNKFSFKQRLEFIINMIIHSRPNLKFLGLKSTKLKQWLIENNPSMFQRTTFSGAPNLADITTAGQFSRFQRRGKRILTKTQDFFGSFNNWGDSTVLVGAFATLVNEQRRLNPNLSQEEIFEKANEIFKRTTLLSGVANTDPAFRSNFSNGRGFTDRLFSKYMSENILQLSNMMKAMKLWTMGLGEFKEVMEAMAVFFASSFASALVSSWFGYINGFTDDDELFEDFILNELILSNLLGAIPYANLITPLFQISDGKLVDGFASRFPFVDDIGKIIDTSYALAEVIIAAAQGNESPSKVLRELVRFTESTGVLLGIPFSNIRKMVGYITMLETKVFGGDSYYAYEEFFYSRTTAQQLGLAIKSNDEKKLSNYLGITISNLEVKEEIMRVVSELDDPSLSMKFDKDTFTAQNPLDDNEMITYKIPEATREKYKLLAQRALNSLIKNGKYKRMSEKEKLSAIQRVINYYYDFMKDEILKQEYKDLSPEIKKEIDYDRIRRRKLLTLSEVIGNAVRKY